MLLFRRMWRATNSRTAYRGGQGVSPGQMAVDGRNLPPRAQKDGILVRGVHRVGEVCPHCRTLH